MECHVHVYSIFIRKQKIVLIIYKQKNKYDILVLFKIQFGNIISGFPMDRFSIGHEFPVHFFERKGKWLQKSTSYWLSLQIHSSGWLLSLNLAQSELKKWEFTSYTISVRAVMSFPLLSTNLMVNLNCSYKTLCNL